MGGGCGEWECNWEVSIKGRVLWKKWDLSWVFKGS